MKVTTIHSIVNVKHDSVDNSVMLTLQLECQHVAYELLKFEGDYTIGDKYECEQYHPNY